MSLRIWPIARWPTIDQGAWQAATTPPTLLTDTTTGAAAHWSPKTAKSVKKRYGQFLYWFDSAYGSPEATSPIDRMTNEVIEAYVRFVVAQYPGPDGSVSVTAYSMTRDLREAVRVMWPDLGLSHLTRIVRRLDVRRQPVRRKVERIVELTDLFKVGLAHMKAAEADTDLPPRERAAKFRDGLIVALLAMRPVRLENLHNMNLGHQVLIRDDDGVAFHFPAEELKWRAGPPLSFPLPKELDAAFQRYLTFHRKLLVRDSVTDALWLTIRSTAMSVQALYQQIVTVTKVRLGRPVNPHLFRDCAATYVARHDPTHVSIIARILDHSTLRTAEQHYIHAGAGEASQHHADIIECRRRTARMARGGGAHIAMAQPCGRNDE
jgi:integrase/recombinase XerD